MRWNGIAWNEKGNVRYDFLLYNNGTMNEGKERKRKGRIGVAWCMKGSE
jgi:hypothetical protein